MLAAAEVIVATITAGQSLSAAVHIGAGTIVALDVPAIDSAALTFQVSTDGGATYRELKDSALAAVSLGASTGDAVFQAPAGLQRSGVHLKVRSGTAASPVNQTLATAIRIVVKP